jgi:hypothetical protein
VLHTALGDPNSARTPARTRVNRRTSLAFFSIVFASLLSSHSSGLWEAVGIKTRSRSNAVDSVFPSFFPCRIFGDRLTVPRGDPAARPRNEGDEPDALADLDHADVLAGDASARAAHSAADGPAGSDRSRCRAAATTPTVCMGRREGHAIVEPKLRGAFRISRTCARTREANFSAVVDSASHVSR